MSALSILPFQPDREARHAALDQLPRSALSRVFIPTDYQKEILAVLDGKALRTDAIAAKTGNRRGLFRDPGGIPELRAHGLVDWHRRIGFFRPDALPPELKKALEGGT
ncbi:MAG: hypothetical protein JNM56_15990 [Planctomycetia bacterium]|nr:hypothetical protein [Planctomycetia bacterium]